MATGAEPLHDAVCFHCQQCAEKYLKALLKELGLPVPRVHDLDELLIRLLPHRPTLTPLRSGLVLLTDYAVETRYPGFFATKRHATSALKWAIRVRKECRTLLGLKS
jgi:HEPN domain-containing protein